MAYQTGDIILDTHYNGFASDINDVWGVGNGDSGYGQSSEISAVSDGVTITATQWSTLLSRISSSASHQGSSITAITSPSTSDPIEAYTALSGNITTITTNRTNQNAFGSSSSVTGINNTDWTTSLTVTNTLTFAGGDEARYFFNAGGRIGISVSHETGNSKDNEWNDLCDVQAGTYYINANDGGKSGGSGSATVNLTSTGYYDLTTSYTTMFQQFADTAPYTANYLRYRALTSAVHGDGNGNNGEVITIEVLLQDDAAETSYDKSVYSVLDNVTGQTTVTFQIDPPATTYIANTWGTPTLGTPVVTPSGAPLT